jgi:hypothetical protein
MLGAFTPALAEAGFRFSLREERTPPGMTAISTVAAPALPSAAGLTARPVGGICRRSRSRLGKRYRTLAFFAL